MANDIADRPAVALDDALETVGREKAGILPPFLGAKLIDDGLAAWQRLYDNPAMAWCQYPPRYLMGPDMYLEPAFAEIATHPVVLGAARRVLEVDISLASYHVVATPPNADEPSANDINVNFHVDHVIYSQVPVPDSPDNVFVCVWVNFHDMGLENGPLRLAVGTDKFNIGWEFFVDGRRPHLSVYDMHWERLLAMNVGPAGTSGVYSGKTWHTASNNCSPVTRKGLQIMFTPLRPLTALTRPWFDIAGLDPDRHAALKSLVGGRVPIPEPDPQQRKVFESRMVTEQAAERRITDPRYNCRVSENRNS